MKFHLVYSGKLSSASHPRPKEVRDIRDQLSPQLKRLWETHQALKVLKTTAWVPGPGNNLAWVTPPGSPFHDPPTTGYEMAGVDQDSFVNLCVPIERVGQPFIPLVRKSLDLTCSLEILFLRKGEPGALVTQDGDVDNRMKLLLDALRVPDADVARDVPQKESPTYCLMESDSLVQGLDIDTDRLLTPQTENENEVHLVIQVSVHVLRVGEWNVCLL